MSLPTTDLEGEGKLSTWNSPVVCRYTSNIFPNKCWNSDDLGLRSPPIQNKFQTKSATFVVAQVGSPL